jgi:site-specific recombinase XerD
MRILRWGGLHNHLPEEDLMATDLRRRMLADMQLRGLSARTQEAYARAVRQLAEHYGRSPDTLTEEELRDYFLHIKNVKRYSRSTSTIALCGIKFFFENTVKRDWPTLTFVRPPREKKLPVILTVEEVHRILAAVRLPRYRACLATIYSCGLRLTEALNLQIPDIDAARRLIHIHRGKGAKDRYVPLPDATLILLRTFWKTHRNPTWIFPAPGRGGIGMPTASEPMARSSIQIAFGHARDDAGIHKRASVRSLRHAYATHLVESGVNLRLIQEYLGHSSPATTAIYTHLTQKATAMAVVEINRLMHRL